MKQTVIASAGFALVTALICSPPASAGVAAIVPDADHELMDGKTRRHPPVFVEYR
jgi:hypothetical protein